MMEWPLTSATVRCGATTSFVALRFHQPSAPAIALVAFSERTAVLAGAGRIVVVARCHAGRWLAVRPVAEATIRIDVDMETVVGRRAAA
jgi:hypothetical protein